MKKTTVWKKLRSRAGETLSETLISLLVAALALVMLAGAVASSANVIKKSREKLDMYYAANEDPGGVVKMTGSGTSGKVSITADGLQQQEIDIAYYTNGEFGSTPVIAYRKSD